MKKKLFYCVRTQSKCQVEKAMTSFLKIGFKLLNPPQFYSYSSGVNTYSWIFL